MLKSTQIAGSTVMKGNYCTGMSEIEDFFRIEHYLRILQACTGIEDFGIALHHLEEANWILMVSFLKVVSKLILRSHLIFLSFKNKGGCVFVMLAIHRMQ